MANYKKFCGECLRPVPPGWNQRYCPYCGGRIKLKIVKRHKESQARPKYQKPETEETPGKPRGFRLSRKKIRPGTVSIFSAREKSVLGPRFLTMSPVLMCVLNVLSAGLRSTFWLINRMPSILMMAKPEEKNIKFPVVLWLISYFTFFVLVLTAAFKFFAGWRLNLIAALQSRFFIGMASALSISFLLDRYLLYWSREAIIDELLKSGFDSVRSRALAFAPSPLMIWLFGAPYIQSHINRMIKKKGLNSYKKPTAARVRKSAPSSKKRESSPEPDSP